MSVTFNIASNSPDEFNALESEGAPWQNLSNSNWGRIMRLLGMTPDWCGRASATEWAEAAEWTLNTISLDEYEEMRVRGLLDVAQAAARLGRDVTWG